MNSNRKATGRLAPVTLFKTIKKCIQYLTGLWRPWRFRIIKSFDFLNCSCFVFLIQLVIVYGIIFAPSGVNASPLWQTEKWIYSGNRVSEFRPASLMPHSEVVLVNRSSLHRNEHEKRVLGITALVEVGLKAGHEETNDRTEKNEGGFFHPVMWLLYGFFITYAMCRLTPNDKMTDKRERE